MGGLDDSNSALTTVEMLQCCWGTEEPVNSEWRYVAPMHHARDAHGLVYFEGKLIAAGGDGRDSVECFTLPTAELPDGQWEIVRPMSQANTLFGILKFGEDLLFVGRCIIGLFLSRRDLFCLESATQEVFQVNVFASHATRDDNEVTRDCNQYRFRFLSKENDIRNVIMLNSAFVG